MTDGSRLLNDTPTSLALGPRRTPVGQSRPKPVIAMLGALGTDLLAASGWLGERPEVLRARRERLAGIHDLLFRAPSSLSGPTDDPPAVARRAASHLLAQLESSSAAVLAEERMFLALPLWRGLAERPLQIVLVIASPERGAARLVRAEGIAPAAALARYDTSLRAAVEACRGLDVVVVGEDDDIAARAGLELLAGEDHSAAFPPALEVVASPPGPETDAVLREIAELHGAVLALRGVHRAFDPPPLPDPSPWASALAAADAGAIQLFDALSWAGQQLEVLLRAEPHAQRGLRRTPHRRDGDGEEDLEGESQFHEPDEDGPYRLSASEDRHAYHRWLAWHRQPSVIGALTDTPRRAAATRRLRSAPLISVLVPVWCTPRAALERCVGSVLAQTAATWELILCDDASGDPALTAYLQSLPRLDRRIKVTALEHNGGISAATNAALALASGEFVAFLDHDDELAPHALASVAAVLAATPDADVVYSDEDKIDAAGERFDPLFKPEWSPDLLLSFAYLCHLTVVRRALVEDLGGLRSEFDGSQDYDLSLRATERARRILHIPDVLYHWRSMPGSAASDSATSIAKPWAYAAGVRAITSALERRKEPGEVSEDARFPGRYHVRRAVSAKPLVSIIIPFRDEPALLATCATSLRADPGYDRYELVLVDNGSELPETETLLERLGTEPNVRILRQPGPFNWAAINNSAAREAAGDVLLFLNNDIEARQAGWLDALVGHIQRPEVGAVGARLVYGDGSIQHAGVAIGLGGIAGHVLRGLPGDIPGYNSIAIATRDCSVVTGACMMVRRSVFEEVGGFDELLAVAFNDVDFCLKLREAGYLIVFTPLAELVHHESKSRGHTDDFFESKRILARWAQVIAAGDPYMNPHLSHWRYWCPLTTAQENDRWRNYLETYVLTRGSSSTT